MNIKKKVRFQQILTLREVAEALRLGRITTLRLVQSGRLRAFRAGRDWRILRTDLEQFMLPRTGRQDLVKGGRA
jgi:excisionase family DNA binding protein